MKTIPRALLAASLFLLGYPSFGQVPKTPPRAPDGGTREIFDSIFIPSMPNAPFRATVNTEWIRHLPDGSDITLKNHRSIVRDTAGRIYQERAFFVPDDGKQESTVRQIEISDPAAHELYVCRLAERLCRLMQFSAPAVVGSSAVGTAGVESLGTQTISGLETIGTRETTLVESGTIGNEAPLLAKKEFWYSPQLGINLITRRQDPRFASEQNFEVTDITLGEPDAKLFEPPSGYKVIDLRKPPVISSPQSSSEN